MAKSDGNRPARVGERIRQELMTLLMRGAIKDPGVTGVVIHHVDVSKDLQHAKVYVRLLENSSDERKQRRLLSGLERAAGFLRLQLGPKLQTRYTPELRFFWDDTADRACKLELVLDEIRQEREESEG